MRHNFYSCQYYVHNSCNDSSCFSWGALKQKRATRPFTISTLYLFIHQLCVNAHIHTHTRHNYWATAPMNVFTFVLCTGFFFGLFFFCLDFRRLKIHSYHVRQFTHSVKWKKNTTKKRYRSKVHISTIARKMGVALLSRTVNQMTTNPYVVIIIFAWLSKMSNREKFTIGRPPQFDSAQFRTIFPNFSFASARRKR